MFVAAEVNSLHKHSGKNGIYLVWNSRGRQVKRKEVCVLFNDILFKNVKFKIKSLSAILCRLGEFIIIYIINNNQCHYNNYISLRFI